MVKEYCRPGYHTVTPGLSVTGSVALLQFLERAFNARIGEVHKNADGTIGHGEIHIGDSLIEVSEGRPEWPARPCSLHYYVPDTDAVYHRAIAAGAVSLTAPENAPYGDRAAGVRDPSGNNWFIATRLEGPAIPNGFHSITPYVITRHAGSVMDLARLAFGAVERMRVPAENGGIMHAEMELHGSIIEFSDGSAQWPPRPCNLHVYVEDVDATYRKAIDAWASSLYGPKHQPYGDREAGVTDAGGNQWFIATYQGS